MKVWFLTFTLFSISLILTQSLNNLSQVAPIITPESINQLKQFASFEVYDYENHPFKNFTINQFKKRLGVKGHQLKPKKGPSFFATDNTDLPVNFDSRSQWPECIHPIRDQGDCGSCWAFAATEVLSDRICIASAGKENFVLSPQELVSCDLYDFGCDGGYLDASWNYLSDDGVVTDSCFPYTSGKDGENGECRDTCVNTDEEFKRHRAISYEERTRLDDIKQAIVDGGPVEAAFGVYEDFLSYKGGIYRVHSSVYLGGHAVKVIGWGREEDTDFWIVANSWGSDWGENGFFRIAFDECGIDDSMIYGIPKVNNESELFLIK